MAQFETDSTGFSSPASTIASLPSTMSTEVHTRDDLFYFHSVVFLAESKLFKVPRYGLPGDAAVFDTMFANATNGAGSSDENPIRLDADVSAADFRSLLKAAFPPPGMLSAVLNLDEWMGVLTLATKWQLESMKEKAVAGADAEIQKKTNVDKILLAKRYGVTKWLKEGYCALVHRQGAITPEERKKLGWETYGRLMDVRERGREGLLDKMAPTTAAEKQATYCSTCSGNHVAFCTDNVGGTISSYMRYCSSSSCGGKYHGVGCPANQPLSEKPKSKDQVLAEWATVNFEALVEEEFGVSVMA